MVPEIIDTHAHLYLTEFDEDRNAVIQRARDTGVKKIYLPNIDERSVEQMISLVERYPDLCCPMIGLHPCSVKEDAEEHLSRILAAIDGFPFVAIGEIGTDLYWDTTFRELQIECFNIQIRLAKEKRLPVAIHSRASLDLNIDIIAAESGPELSGVFHCFNGTVEQAHQIIDMGFYLGIGGVITFKNSGLVDVVARLPLESMVLETDAPFLAPHPHRGKRNESSYLPLVAEKIAAALGTSVGKVYCVTTENAAQLFGSR
jgi:TatD DNase family protein